MLFSFDQIKRYLSLPLFRGKVAKGSEALNKASAHIRNSRECVYEITRTSESQQCKWELCSEQYHSALLDWKKASLIRSDL